MNNKKALITGITGQDGSYLAELLLEKEYEVHGIVRRTSQLKRGRIDHLFSNSDIYGKRLFLHYSDLNDATTLRRIFRKTQPDEFYHLAGQSHVGLSFDIPESTCDEIAGSTLKLLEICRDLDKPVRFFHAASSEIFGKPALGPQDEYAPHSPVNPYGCAKSFAVNLSKVYRTSYNMYISNGILYNHESPRRGENFVTRKITLAAAKIAKGKQGKLFLGNMDAQRDWGHASDYVSAMWLAMQADSGDDYIVATGELHSIKDLLDAAFNEVELDWRKHVETDITLFRPYESSTLYGDSSKIINKLGWSRKYTFASMIREMVQEDLKIA